MTTWVDEFLYRGRKPGSKDEPAWHVIVAECPTGWDGVPKLHGPLTPAQALDRFGMTLPTIINEINGVLIEEVTGLRAEKQTFEERLATERKTILDAAATEVLAARQATVDTLSQIKASLEAVDKLSTEEPSNPALHFLTGGLFGK